MFSYVSNIAHTVKSGFVLARRHATTTRPNTSVFRANTTGSSGSKSGGGGGGGCTGRGGIHCCFSSSGFFKRTMQILAPTNNISSLIAPEGEASNQFW